MDPDTDTPQSDVDERLDELMQAVTDLREKCLIQSAYRATQEARRLAKAERRLVPYLTANFYVMNLSQDLFEPEAGREAAVENIALLESPERARAFQGDYDEGEYEHTVQWMSACSYDNLATATGMLQGYNSPGMQACIADGIGVCRRTGKLQCIACFREYATNVHRAGDDLSMAAHHARTNLTAKPDLAGGNDRRCVGAHDLAGVLMLAGHLEPAYEAAGQSLSLAGTYHNPMRARRMARVIMRQAGHLAGRSDWVETGTDPAADRTPRGEDPAQDLRDDLAEATGDAARGDVEAAIRRLVPWDEQLSARKCVHSWFEVRLHLVALHRMAGKADRAAALAKPLEARARKAQDYLTLRRLEAMLSGELPPAPFPTAAAISTGPYAPQSATAAGAPFATQDGSGSAQDGAATAAEDASAERPSGPLRPLVEQIGERLNAVLQASADAEGPPDVGGIIEQIVAVPPEQVTDRADAASLLHMLGFVARAGVAQPGRAWEWATAVAARHPTDAVATALRAQLGVVLRSDDASLLASAIKSDELEAAFRRAMDLDPNWPGGFARAGAFFMDEGNEAEAERCLARAFRLDRSDEAVASRLADIYAATDRPADALAVLDMCLREGVESPDLLWKAGTRAVALERHESALTYLDKLEEVEPGRPWVQYYRGLSLLELHRPAEALEAADKEAERAARPDALHVQATRAAAAAQLDRPDEVRRHLGATLAVPLRSIEDLTHAGITACHTRMWTAALKLPDNDPVRGQVLERLLASGLTPDGVWEYHRTGPGAKSAEPVQGMMHYLVDLRQPLGPEWAASHACPPGADEWAAYLIRYGVLAASEDEAREVALGWQSRSAGGAAEVINVDSDAGPFADRPGVTWRTAPEEAE